MYAIDVYKEPIEQFILNLIELTIEKGVDLNSRHSIFNMAAIHFAAGHAAIPVVQALLKAGVNVGVKDLRGRTSYAIALIRLAPFDTPTKHPFVDTPTRKYIF